LRRGFLKNLLKNRRERIFQKMLSFKYYKRVSTNRLSNLRMNIRKRPSTLLRKNPLLERACSQT
jgi:hypothetical protein